MIVCGIDPGFTGAMAFLSDQSNEVIFEKIPIKVYNVTKAGAKRHTLDFDKFYENLITYNTDFVYMELIYPMSSWSSLVQFNFGICYGGLMTALESWGGIYDLVSPWEWQRGLGIQPKRRKDPSEEKEDVKILVSWYIKGVYPNQKFAFGKGERTNHNITDAVGIARYGMLKLKEIERESKLNFMED